MILGMMSSGLSGVRPFLLGPVRVGGLPNFYIATSDPENWTGAPRPLPGPIGTLARITTANNKAWMVSAVAMVVSDNGIDWTECSGMDLGQSGAADVWWNGSHYYYYTKRSADGITWTDIPNLPASNYVVMARQSDGAVVSWRSPSSGNGFYSVTLDNGATWNTRAFNYLSAPPTRVSTDGSRCMFNTDGIRCLITDDLFVSASIASGLDVTGASVCGNGVFMSKAGDGWWNMGGGAARARVLTGDYGGSSAVSLSQGLGVWVAVKTVGSDFVIQAADDGGTTFADVGTITSGAGAANPSIVVIGPSV